MTRKELKKMEHVENFSFGKRMGIKVRLIGKTLERYQVNGMAYIRENKRIVGPFI